MRVAKDTSASTALLVSSVKSVLVKLISFLKPTMLVLIIDTSLIRLFVSVTIFVLKDK